MRTEAEEKTKSIVLRRNNTWIVWHKKGDFSYGKTEKLE